MNIELLFEYMTRSVKDEASVVVCYSSCVSTITRLWTSGVVDIPVQYKIWSEIRARIDLLACIIAQHGPLLS
jgi:hypothetical protein